MTQSHCDVERTYPAKTTTANPYTSLQSNRNWIEILTYLKIRPEFYGLH